MEDYQIDNIVHQLTTVEKWVNDDIKRYESMIQQLCPVASEIFSTEPTLLELQAPITIIGDGLDNLGLVKIFRSCTSKYCLYLGNYGGDGKNSSWPDDYGRGFDKRGNNWITILLILAFKIRYPKSLFLLKANFNPSVPKILVDEPEMENFHEHTYSDRILFDCLRSIPVAALINDKIICTHGGISPELHDLDQIRHIKRPTMLPYSPFPFHLGLLAGPPRFDMRRRPVDRDDEFFAKELEFLDKHDLRLICCDRHQVFRDDVSEHSYVRRRVVSLGSSLDSNHFTMNVDANLKCTLKELKPGKRKFRFSFGTGASAIAQSGSSSGVVNPTTTKNSKFEDVAAPMVKPFGWMNISKFGTSNATSKPESSQGVNPSKSSTSTAKNRSNSPEIKPAKGMSKSNTGTTNVVTDKPESSQEARPFDFDLETLYRSKSPGVKRFIGARV